ncbi:MAG: hypothetical protein MJZ49_08360 [Bacteroidales bacterium]|nr:hypothetical protein [Bacteroidales bacterium]
MKGLKILLTLFLLITGTRESFSQPPKESAANLAGQQENSWYDNVKNQEDFGFKQLLDKVLMIEIDDAGIYFPVFIKGRADHAFVILDDNDLALLYVKKYGEFWYKKSEDSLRAYLLQCLSDSISLSTLNEVFPWREAKFNIPVDSIYQYPENEKELFIRRAFPNGLLDRKRYDAATTILKLFQWGHITMGPDESPSIGFFQMVLIPGFAENVMNHNDRFQAHSPQQAYNWESNAKEQERIGRDALISNVLTIEYWPGEVFFPLFIKDDQKHSFVILNERSLRNLYDKTHPESWERNPDAFVGYCMQLIADSISMETLSLISPLASDKIIHTPVDSIFEYTEDQKQLFLQRVFAFPSIEYSGYERATTVRKLFQFGYLVRSDDSFTSLLDKWMMPADSVNSTIIQDIRMTGKKAIPRILIWRDNSGPDKLDTLTEPHILDLYSRSGDIKSRAFVKVPKEETIKVWWSDGVPYAVIVPNQYKGRKYLFVVYAEQLLEIFDKDHVKVAQYQKVDGKWEECQTSGGMKKLKHAERLLKEFETAYEKVIYHLKNCIWY